MRSYAARKLPWWQVFEAVMTECELQSRCTTGRHGSQACNSTQQGPPFLEKAEGATQQGAAEVRVSEREIFLKKGFREDLR